MPTVRYATIDGEVITEKRGGVRKLYVPYASGSTAALLDSNQTQTDTFTYWPYGEVQSRTGTTPTPFQFGGTVGFFHDTNVQTYVKSAFIDTMLGRWLIQAEGASTAGLYNSYAIPVAESLRTIKLFQKVTPISIGYCGPNIGRTDDPCAKPGTPAKPPFTSSTTGVYNSADRCCKAHDCDWLIVKKTTNPPHECGAGDPFLACDKANKSLCNCLKGVKCGKDMKCQTALNVALLMCNTGVLPPPKTKPGSPPTFCA